jgi:hypothetical protein
MYQGLNTTALVPSLLHELPHNSFSSWDVPGFPSVNAYNATHQLIQDNKISTATLGGIIVAILLIILFVPLLWYLRHRKAIHRHPRVGVQVIR